MIASVSKRNPVRCPAIVRDWLNVNHLPFLSWRTIIVHVANHPVPVSSRFRVVFISQLWIRHVFKKIMQNIIPQNTSPISNTDTESRCMSIEYTNRNWSKKHDNNTVVSQSIILRAFAWLNSWLEQNYVFKIKNISNSNIDINVFQFLQFNTMSNFRQKKQRNVWYNHKQHELIAYYKHEACKRFPKFSITEPFFK